MNLFISDLHLSQEQPGTVRLFLHFLQQHAPQADNLYILGDLFDTWVGDDDSAPPIPSITAALKQLSTAGTNILIQPGNRDFLLGEAFMSATGCSLLPDIYVTELAGTPTLLMHGDLLCTDDEEYQQARKMLRSDAFARDFLSKTIEERRAIAAGYRQRSGEATALKADDIMDVNHEAIAETMRENGVLRLIHGHTHRPGFHDFKLDGEAAQRIVLSEWHENHGAALRITGSNIISCPIELAP
ncbi:UDP-2,3-diacylglucosamine diphosphatase [Pseudomonadota bacterium]